eukprot:5955478-Pyramimonas_sp.AAC.1
MPNLDLKQRRDQKHEGHIYEEHLGIGRCGRCIARRSLPVVFWIAMKTFWRAMERANFIICKPA